MNRILLYSIAFLCINQTVDAQNLIYSDDFETPQTWTIFEEIVSGNSCYAANVGEVARSSDNVHGGSNGLCVWSNKQAVAKSNHVIAAHHISNSDGITGQLRYSTWAYCATTTGLTQASPELSLQSTRAVGGQNLTYIAGIQFIGNQWITDKWNIWHNGTWQTIKLSEFGATLTANTWYYLELNVDMTTNKYLSFKVKGGTIDATLDLTKTFQNAPSGFQIGGEARGWTPSHFVTLESENLWSNCTQTHQNKTYYDDLRLERITQLNYTPSTADIVNPERGFYHHTETFSTNYTPLSNDGNLANLRSGYTSSGANYSAKTSLILRVFYLESFKNSDISATYLNNMVADFNTLRAAGLKAIIRFAYTQKSTIPYGDAPKSRILTHIAQLSPLLNTHKDVIAAAQMGFIGAYGEQYYTDFFGDASLTPYRLSNTNFQDRVDVLNAFLNALPTDRMVQVRTPQLKQKRDAGVTAPTTTAASFGRIGHHNDCFLATYNDQGTYGNYATGLDDTTRLKPYLAIDSEQVIVGGETCELNPNHSKCLVDGGKADLELRRFHYSFLNADYNHAVNNTWSSCMASIQNGLGYRFELVNGVFPNTAAAGSNLSVQLVVKNVGFAAPFNPRPVELILRNTATGTKYFANVNTNPRQWLPSATGYTISENFCLPSSMPLGNYDLLLNLPDPNTNLYARPEYAIQLANTGIWEATTGYNNLGQTIAVSGAGTCSGGTTFSTTSMALPLELVNFWGNTVECSKIPNCFGKGDKNVLKWQTAHEINVSHFDIERSVDGKIFEKIGEGQAKGSNASYSFTDTKTSDDSYRMTKNAPTLVLYYRLKINDLDNTFSFSKTIALQDKNTEGGKITLYPNPVSDQLTVILPSNTEGVEIVNLLGQTLFTQKGKGTLTIDISHFTEGVYFLKNGNQTARFIKK